MDEHFSNRPDLDFRQASIDFWQAGSQFAAGMANKVIGKTFPKKN